MPHNINIGKLEKQAKFILSETEKSETNKIMEFLEGDFEKLSNVDTGGVKPLIHGIELCNIFREDKAIKKIDRETLLENAPEHENGYFTVPKTID